ncbi:damage-inducible protein DinB [Bacillus sp. RO3]|nr:damage-inducible protein DinB [Bacillus sp. RO3]
MKNKMDYHIWATDKLLTYLDTLPAGVIHKELQSVFPTIERTLYHLYEVDALWFSRLRGQTLQLEIERFSSVGDCITHFHALHKEMADWKQIDQTISYETSSRENYQNTTAEILDHIVNHGTYHRGNITAMLWQLGERGVSTDYIYYLRG